MSLGTVRGELEDEMMSHEFTPTHTGARPEQHLVTA